MTITQHKLPKVRRFKSDDGVPAVSVELNGMHGTGRQVILDEADWRTVSETVSPWWQVHRVGGVEYVVCTSRIAVEIVRRTGNGTMLFLSRLITQPAPGMMVGFANGDRFDCRRANLIVGTRAALPKAAQETRRERERSLLAAMAAANAAAASSPTA